VSSCGIAGDLRRLMSALLRVRVVLSFGYCRISFGQWITARLFCKACQKMQLRSEFLFFATVASGQINAGGDTLWPSQMSTSSNSHNLS
jgi:hypothetical protein